MTDISDELLALSNLMIWASNELERLHKEQAEERRVIKESAATIGRLRAALDWIDKQRFTTRDTITPDNAFEKAQELNQMLVALMDHAGKAIEGHLGFPPYWSNVAGEGKACTAGCEDKATLFYQYPPGWPPSHGTYHCLSCARRIAFGETLSERLDREEKWGWRERAKL